MLRFYFEVARTAYRRQLIYRWANLAGLLTNIFFGIILSYVMIALFQARPVAAGYNMQDALRLADSRQQLHSFLRAATSLFLSFQHGCAPLPSAYHLID